MSEPPPKDRAVRIVHKQGERLVAPDLQDEQGVESWLRAVHVVALHDTWGIALGFGVQAEADLGGLLVAPGLAYDCQGREIVLAEAAALSLPTDWASAGYTLVASYDASPAAADGPAAPCPNPDRPGRERPAFLWRRRGRVRLGDDVPLAAVFSNDGTPDLDLGVRRYVQPLVRPQVSSGVSPPDQPWDRWKARNNRTVIGYQKVVDTTGGGFVGTPFYFAAISLDPRFARVGTAAKLLAPLGTSDVYSSVEEASPVGFTFRVTPGTSQQSGVDTGDLSRLFDAEVSEPGRTSPLLVSWVGVEPVAGCEPPRGFVALIERLRFRFGITGLV